MLRMSLLRIAFSQDVEAWFAELDRLRPEKFMLGGRQQPKPQRRKRMFK